MDQPDAIITSSSFHLHRSSLELTLLELVMIFIRISSIGIQSCGVTTIGFLFESSVFFAFTLVFGGS